tara:strand:- start:166 stop:336 length:171 start_codon:yes stop_codon:yes gene_type:complete
VRYTIVFRNPINPNFETWGTKNERTWRHTLPQYFDTFIRITIQNFENDRLFLRNMD